MVVVALLSVDLVESVDLVSVKLVVNCTYIFYRSLLQACARFCVPVMAITTRVDAGVSLVGRAPNAS